MSYPSLSNGLSLQIEEEQVLVRNDHGSCSIDKYLGGWRAVIWNNIEGLNIARQSKKRVDAVLR